MNFIRSKVLYISSSFWLFGVESRDLSQAELKNTVVKPEQIHKIKIIFTQNGQKFSQAETERTACKAEQIHKMTTIFT